MSQILGMIGSHHGPVVDVPSTGGGNPGGGTPPPPPDPGDPFLQFASGLSVIDAVPSNLRSLCASAPAGAHIRLAPGNYNNMVIDVPNGTETNPITLCPRNKNAPPVFGGTNEFSGNYAHFFGLKFNNKGTGKSRLLMLQDLDHGLLAYCEFEPARLAVEFRSKLTTNCRVHRCHFLNQDPGTGNGGEAIKLGVGSTRYLDTGALVDRSLFEDFNIERETISLKARGAHIYRCHFKRSRVLSFRSCKACIAEECRLDNLEARFGISVGGPDHQVINCVASRIEVNKGNEDGDTVISNADEANGRRMAAKRVLLSRNRADIEIGHLLFDDSGLGTENVDDTMLFANEGTIVDRGLGTTNLSTGVARAEAVRLSAELVGLRAYRANVIGA